MQELVLMLQQASILVNQLIASVAPLSPRRGRDPEWRPHLGRDACGTWAALRAAGRAVEAGVVGRDPQRLAAAEPVLDRWTRAPVAGDAATERPAARVEFAEIQAAVARGDLAALEAYGGINGALARMRDLSAAEVGAGRAAPAITRGRMSRSGCTT